MAGAHALLSELASKDPPDPKALTALARLYLTAQQFDAARAVIDRLPESARRDQEVAAIIAALDNAARAADLGEIGELKTRIGGNPNDMQAYFDLAPAAAAA